MPSDFTGTIKSSGTIQPALLTIVYVCTPSEHNSIYLPVAGSVGEVARAPLDERPHDIGVPVGAGEV